MSLSAPVADVGGRRERLLRSASARGLDAVIVTRPELIFYFSGVEPYPGEPGALAMRGDGATLIWSGASPEDLAEGIEVLSYDPYAEVRRGQDGFDAVAAAAVKRLRLLSGHVGLDGDSRPPWLRADASCAADVIAALTREKSPQEVELISLNLGFNDQAFAAVAQRLRAGCSDLDVFDWCCSALARGSGGPVSYDGNIGLGRASDYFDAQPSGVTAAPGDALFVDLYCRIAHYVGDSTRSFAVGSAAPWIRDAHGRLEQALEEIAPHLRPGMQAASVDRSCRGLLDDAVEGGVFPHHTGHGVGLRAHEPPYLIPGSQDVLRVGDVICVEPGLYFPGRGGLRLEEVFLVTDDGGQCLTGFPRALTEVEVG
jgi:Xaa-Pro aminopeptidase